MSHERFDLNGAYGGSFFTDEELTVEQMKEQFAPEVEDNIPSDYRDQVGYKQAETTCPEPPAKYVCFWNYNAKEVVPPHVHDGEYGTKEAEGFQSNDHQGVSTAPARLTTDQFPQYVPGNALDGIPPFPADDDLDPYRES